MTHLLGVGLEVLLVLVDVLDAVLDPVEAPLELAVDPGDLALEHVAVRVLAVGADLLLAVGTREHVGLLLAHVAAQHDALRVRVRQLA